MSKLDITSIALGVGIGIALVYLYQRYTAKSGYEIPTAPERTQQSPPGRTLVLFWGDWCGHSKAFKPVWDAARSDLNSRGVETLEFTDKEIDMAANGVPGFPTVRLYPNGFAMGSKDFVEFKGQRSPEELIKFSTA